MAIKAECPLCHRKQAVKNKICACGQRMDNAKRSKKVKYHIVYRLPNGKQKQEFAGYSITEAKTAEGKRLTQRYENHRILQKVPEEKMTFRELTEWYLELPKVKDLKAYRETKIRLNNFNAVLGEQIVGSVKLTDLENYQYVRKASGIAATTNDQEQRDIKTAINKAFKNDLVSGHTKKTFDNWERLTKKEERSRNRPVALEEYAALLNGCAAEHLRSALILGMHTGMRPGEIKGLRWSHVDLKSGFIRLPADIVKEKRDKAIPPYINRHVDELLRGLPTPIRGGPVLTYAGKKLGHLKVAMQTACRNAGIPHGTKVKGGFVLKDLRSTFKTNMARAGVDRVYRDTIMGHSLEGMEAHYLKPSEEDLAEAMKTYTAWFDSEIANVDHFVDHENSNS